MYPRVARLSMYVCFIVLSASSAFGQLIPGWEAKQFTLERIDTDRWHLVREVEVVGIGPNAGQQIFADDIEWNVRTGEFIATGNVLLVTPTSRLSAERVVFNTKTQLGTFETASGIASLGTAGQKDRSMFGTLEPDVYFYGEKIDKIGSDKYRITKGGFTTCVQPTPRWDVVSNSATIDLGDYAILRNAVMRVKDVPVFYLPILYYPIQDDDRATGFLLPTYGTSTYRGQSLSNAFFWAINRSQDATFFHDLFMSRGQGTGGEYRYTSGPGAEGFFRGYYLNEKESTIDRPGGTPFVQPARRSYELRGRLVQPLPLRMTARANVDYFSSLVTQQLYNTNIFDATRSQRSYDGTVTGAWGHVSLTTNYSRREIFLSDTRSITSGSEPSAVVNFASTRIKRLPLYFAMNGDATRSVYRDKDTGTAGIDTVQDFGVGRIDVFPTLRAPLTTWPFLNITTYLGVRSTYFSESLSDRNTQVPVGLWRRYAEMRTELTGPVFSKVYSPQNGFAERMKHVIEPNVSIQRTTNIDTQSRIPTTGSVSDVVIGGVTRMSYGITNRVLLRKPAPEGADAVSAAASAPREFLSVSLLQSYYSDPNASRYDQQLINFGLRPPSKFSPVILNVRAAPTLLSNATLVAEYDANEGQLEAVSASGGITYTQVQARAGWSNRLQQLVFGQPGIRTNTVDANATFNLYEGRLGGMYSMNWDITRRQLLQQRWVGNYNAQCCGVAIEYQEFAFGFGAVIPKDRRFNLSFTLAGIGSFANFFGAFGVGGGRQY